MISDNESGICCNECEHEEKTLTKEQENALKERLEWVNGDAVCPSCGASVWFESYID